MSRRARTRVAQPEPLPYVPDRRVPTISCPSCGAMNHLPYVEDCRLCGSRLPSPGRCPECQHQLLAGMGPDDCTKCSIPF